MMKKHLLLICFFFISVIMSEAQTPLALNGRLKLNGNQLVNECGKTVQLRGMSTHGIAFHTNCYRESAVAALAKDWGADVLRLAVYTADEGGTAGYLKGNKEYWNNWIDQMVNITEKYGIYCLIDWHIMAIDPNNNLSDARTFFEIMADRYKNKKHVLYEICNEPTASWSNIRNYAEQIIPAIRAKDKEAIIIVGNDRWSSKPMDAANNPVSQSNRYNVMYSFHFYAASHTNSDYMDQFKGAASKIPLFVTEWGTTSADGVSNFSQGNSDTWLGLMNGGAVSNLKVSWCNWAFVDKGEASSALTNDACFTGNWNSRTTSGNYIYGKINSSDQFTKCDAVADDDADGVINSVDNCANTPAGTPVTTNGCPVTADADKDGVIDPRDLCASTPSGTEVNTNGCPISQGFSSNVCVGFNNVQSYVRQDFTSELANFEYASKPSDANPVYSSILSGGQMVVTVKNADPDYKTFGISFGLDQTGKNVPIDIRAYPVLKFDANFVKSGTYNATDVLIEVQLEDINGKILNMDALGNLQRAYVPLNVTKVVELNFRNGLRPPAAGTACSKFPCYEKDFDYSKVVKINMWVNPQAGGTAKWVRPAFSGTWKIDNFSIGYNAAMGTGSNCTAMRDDDGDGVKQEADKCQDTPRNSPVDATGCAIVTSRNDKLNELVTIYPVPASAVLHIDQFVMNFSGATIMDVAGNKVKEINLKYTSEEISLQDLPAGVYMMQLTGENKSELVKVMVY